VTILNEYVQSPWLRWCGPSLDSGTRRGQNLRETQCVPQISPHKSMNYRHNTNYIMKISSVFGMATMSIDYSLHSSWHGECEFSNTSFVS